MAVRWPEATGLTSYLSGCLALTSQRCGFAHRRRCGGGCRAFAHALPPRPARSLCSAFRRFWSGGTSFSPPEPHGPCWHTVATLHPVGDCDSPEPETSPGYLTWVGAASYRSWPRSSSFASRRRANATGRAGESCLHPPACAAVRRGRVNQPTRPFPSHLGLSLRPSRTFARS